MKRYFLYFNIGAYCSAIAFLGIFPVNAFLTGYPWAITCYNCNICRLACPIGIDPHGFIVAALTNDPDYYISTSHLRLGLAQAQALDKDMPVSAGKLTMKAGKMLESGVDAEREVNAVAMKAKHVAKFCFLCGNCARRCPIKLPIMDIAEDLAKDGGFGE